MAESRKPSLIERMGGAEAASGLLISAVEIFYYKLVNDAQLFRFFEGKDMAMLKKKQVDFLAYVFGGPTEYSGKGIFEAHEHLIREQGKNPFSLFFKTLHLPISFFISNQGLLSIPTGLNEIHFDIVATHFRDTLIELQAGKELVDEAMRILGTARPVFVRANLPEYNNSNSDNDSSGRGSENITAIAGQLQELLLSTDAELERTRHEVKRLVSHTTPENMQRLKGALRMRGPGLTDLLDQALEQS
jgi:hemoglobin